MRVLSRVKNLVVELDLVLQAILAAMQKPDPLLFIAVD